MSDFGNMIREALTNGPPFQPQSGREALDKAIQRYDQRARTIRGLTLFSLLFMTGIFVWGVAKLVGAGAEDTRSMIIGLALVVGGITGIGFNKLWFMLTQNHLMVMRELKGLEFLALGGDEE